MSGLGFLDLSRLSSFGMFLRIFGIVVVLLSLKCSISLLSSNVSDLYEKMQQYGWWFKLVGRDMEWLHGDNLG